MTRVALDGIKSTVELRQDVVFLRWTPGVTIEGRDAAAAVTTVRTLSRGSRYPLLVEMAGTAWVTAEARRLFAASNVAPRIALLGESPVDRVMATFFLGRVRSPCPARFFTSSEEAMRWLNNPEQAAPGAGTTASGDDRAG
jgi:hypothetical protein